MPAITSNSAPSVSILKKSILLGALDWSKIELRVLTLALYGKLFFPHSSSGWEIYSFVFFLPRYFAEYVFKPENCNSMYFSL